MEQEKKHNIFYTIFVKGFWQTFCVAWIYNAFWKTFVVKKLKFDKWKGWIYLLPALVLLAIFTVWPIINTLRISMLEGYNATQEYLLGKTFDVGFQNFVDIFKLDGFGTAMGNTILLCVITVPLSTILALLIAVALNSIKPLQKTLQTIFFLPYVTNSIAIGMVFYAMFNVKATDVGLPTQTFVEPGLINNILGFFGIDPIYWTGQTDGSYWANMAVLIIYIVWNALPFKILVLLGGLQGINKQYYEAAKIDSTPRWRVFTKVTVPLLSPMIAYVVITGFIGGFKEYSSIVGIFGDANGNIPANLYTMVAYVYEGIEAGTPGLASAAALILFVIIFIVTMINLYVNKKSSYR